MKTETIVLVLSQTHSWRSLHQIRITFLFIILKGNEKRSEIPVSHANKTRSGINLPEITFLDRREKWSTVEAIQARALQKIGAQDAKYEYKDKERTTSVPPPPSYTFRIDSIRLEKSITGHTPDRKGDLRSRAETTLLLLIEKITNDDCT